MQRLSQRREVCCSCLKLRLLLVAVLLLRKEKWGSVVLLIERELETADSAEDCAAVLAAIVGCVGCIRR